LNERESQRDQSNILTYQGVITENLGDNVFVLDNRFSLYLTHVLVDYKGRGLRVGTTVKVFNGYTMFRNGLLHGFGLTMYSFLQIISFSKMDTLFKPLSTRTRLKPFWNKLSLSDSQWLFEVHLSLKNKFPRTMKKWPRVSLSNHTLSSNPLFQREKLLDKFLNIFKPLPHIRNIYDEFLSPDDTSINLSSPNLPPTLFPTISSVLKISEKQVQFPINSWTYGYSLFTHI